MNSLDDLRLSLEQHTSLAPDGLGMVEQARAGAIRIRRRRRIAATLAAVTAVLVIAVGVPLAAHNTTLPAHPGPSKPGVGVSLSLAAGSGFSAQSQSAQSGRQSLLVETPDHHFPAEVNAYAPGTFQPEKLMPGTKVQVGGHEALLVPSLDQAFIEHFKDAQGKVLTPPVTENALVWQDPSGVWITVAQVETRAHLMALAAAIRIGEPAPALGPLGLAELPAGYAVIELSSRVDPKLGYSEGITLAPGGTEPDSSAPPVPGTTKVSITAVPRSDHWWREPITLPPAQFTVAGRPAWWFAGANGRVPADVGGRLLIDTGGCGIQVVTRDAQVITRADLQKMMSRANFASCTDKKSWVPILS